MEKKYNLTKERRLTDMQCRNCKSWILNCGAKIPECMDYEPIIDLKLDW